MESLRELTEGSLPTGRVEWIGIARERRGEIEELQTAEVRESTGIEGEHHATSGRSKRQVSLIQAEHLPLIAKFAGMDEVSPALLRRNLVISGVNLLALKQREFQIGDIVLRGTGPCPPCSRMEENLGPGGYSAVRGHGGIVAEVLRGGTFKIGDEVVVLNTLSTDESLPEAEQTNRYGRGTRG